MGLAGVELDAPGGAPGVDEIEAALELDLAHPNGFVGGPGSDVISELPAIAPPAVLQRQVVDVDVKQKGADDAALGCASKKRDRCGESMVNPDLDGAILKEG